MAEFKAGDRVVKMSGTGAGKYGTVNSVMENGTLNVTFDGEKIPRFCDPMRCGQVAANAKFLDGTMLDTGIQVKKTRGLFGDTSHIGKVGTAVRVYDEGGEGAAVMVRYPGSTELFEEDSRTLVRVNSRAANAVALPSDSIRSESDLARAFSKKGWKLIMEGNRWTLRDDKGTVRWQDSFGGDVESYDRVFRRFASYLNLR